MVQKYVMFAGQVYRWEEKEPYTKSGRSIWGGFEVNPSSRTTKCHECGDWFRKLGTHVAYKHNPAAYRQDHNVRQRRSLGFAPLNNRRNKGHILTTEDRQRGRSHALQLRPVKAWSTGERRNRDGSCPEQISTTIAAFVAQYERVPTSLEMKGSIRSYARRHFGSWNGLLTHLGYGDKLVKVFRQKEELVEILRDFYVLNGRLPYRHEWGKGRLPTTSVFCNAFGTIARSYAAAGLGLTYQRNRALMVRPDARDQFADIRTTEILNNRS